MSDGEGERPLLAELVDVWEQVPSGVKTSYPSVLGLSLMIRQEEALSSPMVQVPQTTKSCKREHGRKALFVCRCALALGPRFPED